MHLFLPPSSTATTISRTLSPSLSCSPHRTPRFHRSRIGRLSDSHRVTGTDVLPGTSYADGQAAGCPVRDTKEERTDCSGSLEEARRICWTAACTANCCSRCWCTLAGACGHEGKYWLSGKGRLYIRTTHVREMCNALALHAFFVVRHEWLPAQAGSPSSAVTLEPGACG